MRTMMPRVVLGCTMFIAYQVLAVSQYSGSCSWPSRQGYAVQCMPAHQCASLISSQDIQMTLQICGFSGDIPLVCCVTGTSQIQNRNIYRPPQVLHPRPQTNSAPSQQFNQQNYQQRTNTGQNLRRHPPASSVRPQIYQQSSAITTHRPQVNYVPGQQFSQQNYQQRTNIGANFRRQPPASGVGPQTYQQPSAIPSPAISARIDSPLVQIDGSVSLYPPGINFNIRKGSSWYPNPSYNQRQQPEHVQTSVQQYFPPQTGQYGGYNSHTIYEPSNVDSGQVVNGNSQNHQYHSSHSGTRGVNIGQSQPARKQTSSPNDYSTFKSGGGHQSGTLAPSTSFTTTSPSKFDESFRSRTDAKGAQQTGAFTGNNRSHLRTRPTPTSGGGTRLSKSELKCQEYSKLVTTDLEAMNLLPKPSLLRAEVAMCEHSERMLVVGGRNASKGEFPHMVAVGFNTENGIDWRCGGTLISENYVLTAAHCTLSVWGPPKAVRLGVLTLRDRSDGSHPLDVDIAEIFTHPDYNYPDKYNDIALLRLSQKVTFNKMIRPACLHNMDTISVDTAVATGWGKLEFGGDESDILQKVAIHIIDNEQCSRYYSSEATRSRFSKGILQSMMCAGEKNEHKDTCQGDSGGPLQISYRKNPCLYYVVGITSFGRSCALGIPAVYTRVSHYVPWIESIVWS